VMRTVMCTVMEEHSEHDEHSKHDDTVMSIVNVTRIVSAAMNSVIMQ
jgi:hypothetical protein